MEVAATDEGIEEVSLRDNYHGYKPVRGTKKEIEDELEDLKIEEPSKPVEKPKKKKRKPKPEKEPEPPVVLAAESTFPDNDLGKLFEISNLEAPFILEFDCKMGGKNICTSICMLCHCKLSRVRAQLMKIDFGLGKKAMKRWR